VERRPKIRVREGKIRKRERSQNSDTIVRKGKGREKLCKRGGRGGDRGGGLAGGRKGRYLGEVKSAVRGEIWTGNENEEREPVGKRRSKRLGQVRRGRRLTGVNVGRRGPKGERGEKSVELGSRKKKERRERNATDERSWGEDAHRKGTKVRGRGGAAKKVTVTGAGKWSNRTSGGNGN